MQVVNGLHHFLREGDSQAQMLSVVSPQSLQDPFPLFLHFQYNFSSTSRCLMETITDHILGDSFRGLGDSNFSIFFV